MSMRFVPKCRRKLSTSTSGLRLVRGDRAPGDTDVDVARSRSERNDSRGDGELQATIAHVPEPYLDAGSKADGRLFVVRLDCSDREREALGHERRGNEHRLRGVAGERGT